MYTCTYAYICVCVYLSLSHTPLLCTHVRTHLASTYLDIMILFVTYSGTYIVVEHIWYIMYAIVDAYVAYIITVVL